MADITDTEKEPKGKEGPLIPAHELLQNFIKENNLVVSITPLQVREMKDGALFIDQPSIAVTYGHTTK